MSRWWQNAGTDPETVEIDRGVAGQRMDDAGLHIRDLIGQFESCHHKAGRRLELLIDAIGAGSTEKQPGRRSAPGLHPAERAWQAACNILRAWQVDDPQCVMDERVGPISADDLLKGLGQKTRLKAWQVDRVIERIDSFLRPDHPYQMLVCDLGDHGEPGERPLTHGDDQEKDLLEQTRATLIHDTVDGQPNTLSLAWAIDLLMPCHWDFPSNLRVVLRAIGGHLHSDRPLGACGRNILRSPLRPHAQRVVMALDVFSGRSAGPADADVLRRLGDKTPLRRWLAASLAKTLRLQLHI
ncbi:MAG: hypothetical protein IT442_05645 [Phycisphaeraceae bacterium]|nr:hypothetical protein [Phycisphaeraceae bacterium]